MANIQGFLRKICKDRRERVIHTCLQSTTKKIIHAICLIQLEKRTCSRSRQHTSLRVSPWPRSFPNALSRQTWSGRCQYESQCPTSHANGFWMSLHPALVMFTNNNCYPDDHLGKSHIWTLKICPTCNGSSCFTIYLYIYSVRWML